LGRRGKGTDAGDGEARIIVLTAAKMCGSTGLLLAHILLSTVAVDSAAGGRICNWQKADRLLACALWALLAYRVFNNWIELAPFMLL
jgi:hypothetical protein